MQNLGLWHRQAVKRIRGTGIRTRWILQFMEKVVLSLQEACGVPGIQHFTCAPVPHSTPEEAGLGEIQ